MADRQEEPAASSAASDIGTFYFFLADSNCRGAVSMDCWPVKQIAL